MRRLVICGLVVAVVAVVLVWGLPVDFGPIFSKPLAFTDQTALAIQQAGDWISISILLAGIFNLFRS